MLRGLLSHPESAAAYHGSGCNPSRTTALLRALTEAAQSRLSHIAGSRDDFFRRTYGSAASTLGGEARRRLSAAPNLGLASLDETCAEIVRRVRAVTGMSPLAVDLRRADFDLPVVFVVRRGCTCNHRVANDARLRVRRALGAAG